MMPRLTRSTPHLHSLLAVLLLLTVSTVSAQDSLNVSRHGSLGFTQQELGDMYLSEDGKLHVASREAGLSSFQLGDSGAFEFEGQLPFLDKQDGRLMVTRGDTFHVAGRTTDGDRFWLLSLAALEGGGFAELASYDRYDPHHTSVDGLVLGQGYACIAIADQLTFVDISDPTDYSLLAATTLNVTPGTDNVADLGMVGPYLLALLPGKGLYVLDTTTPAQPTVHGSWLAADAGSELAVQDDLALVSRTGAAPQLLDLSNPAQPAPLGVLSSSTNSGALALRGAQAAACSANLLQLYDISDPAAAQLTATHSFENGPLISLAMSESHIALHSGDTIEMLELASGSSGEPFNLRFGPMQRLLLDGDLAWAAAGGAGLRSIDLSDPFQPMPASRTLTPFQQPIDSVLGFHLSDGLLAVTGFSGLPQEWIPRLAVYDVSDPDAPLLLLERESSSRPPNGRPVDVSLAPPYLLWALGETTEVLNLNSPNHMTQRQDMPLSLLVEGENSLLYGAEGVDRGDLVSFSHDDPGIPAAIDSAEISSDPNSIGGVLAHASGQDLYLLIGEAGSSGFVFRRYDVANPASMFVRGQATLGGLVCLDMAVLEEHLLVPQSGLGLTVYDFSGPADPTVVGYYRSSADQGGAIAARDGHAWAAHDMSLISYSFPTLLDAPEPVTERPATLPRQARIAAAWPNPFNAEISLELELPASAALTLDVYDLLGRRVARLFQGRAQTGRTRVRWTGVDASGRELASGVYLVQLRSGRQQDARRVLLLR